jgi:hypothetical protein
MYEWFYDKPAQSYGRWYSKDVAIYGFLQLQMQGVMYGMADPATGTESKSHQPEQAERDLRCRIHEEQHR